MTIVLVVDVFDNLTNGTTMTAYRFAQSLRENGHEVRVVAIGDKGENPYALSESRIPVATRIAHSQGVAFAKADPSVFERAFQGADVVHFLLPLFMDCKALKAAKKMDVPICGAFHLQPENVTFICHVSKAQWLARAIYRFFNRIFYKNFDHIHCPSYFIANQLAKNGYTAKLHVISNGVDEDFRPGETRESFGDGLIHILMVGRLSPEKRQRVLIDAAAKSKYADKIQLHFAGKGPCREKLIERGKKLPHPPTFDFYSKEELIALIRRCDLYVHPSVVEIEAISCLEAFSCGLVPIICNSDMSATVQFALDERSLFRPDDSQDLAEKIDYWLSHPEEKARMEQEYAKQGDAYRVSASVKKAEEMFAEVIRDHREKRPIPGAGR